MLNETIYTGLGRWEGNHKIILENPRTCNIKAKKGLMGHGKREITRLCGEGCLLGAVNYTGRISHLQSPRGGTLEINAPYPHLPASTENPAGGSGQESVGCKPLRSASWGPSRMQESGAHKGRNTWTISSPTNI